ncbi:MAG: WecB/TagA/CpsF family glycosyltransferase [Candidatus Omnitrophica bacterium]|nr:WecB/TagA/CpsF family glycosyltransferase [Candidatus Omnitrophota bacterium]
MGCPIDNLSVEEMTEVADGFIKSGRPHQYIAINADKIVKMREDDSFREIVLASDLNIVDGQPLMWVSRLFGTPVKQRYGGLDIMEALISVSGKKGYGIYFLGAGQDVVEKVRESYTKKYPDMKLAGWRNGYWTPEEEESVVRDIASSGTDVLFFAMSSPRKEKFLKKHLENMRVPLVVGVGGAFDIIAGKTRRAPQWMQKMGIEWLYRLLQEPRRLWKRYLIGNTKFIWIVIKEFFTRKGTKSNERDTGSYKEKVNTG